MTILSIDPTLRRLPVYLMIDCSSSMNGDAIAAVDQGFRNLFDKLANDPHTADIVWLSVVTYDSIPRQLIPLRPIGIYSGLPIEIGGCSNLGRALNFVTDCIKREVKKQTEEVKGDYNPLIFLMSDGVPTDDWEKSTISISKVARLVACGVGSFVDVKNMKIMTEWVIQMKDMTGDTFDQFVDFVVSVLTTASQETTEVGAGFEIKFQKKYNKIVLF
jgi:uncharacterized protein YegL